MSHLNNHGLVPRVIHEARITYGLVWRDLSASLIPATLMSLAAVYTTGGWSAETATLTVLRCALYFGLYIYSFCLCNQIVGLEEDRINKPDRVIPSGLLNMRGALLRLVIALVVFPLVGFVLGGFRTMGWALAWEAIFLSYNLLGLHRHWFSKNVVFIVLGTVALLGAAWEIAAPLSSAAWQWILVVATTFGFTLHIQDLRDVEGDRATGRRTLPMVLGQDISRWLIAIGIGVLPIVVHLALFSGAQSLTNFASEAILAGLNIMVAVRVVQRRTPHDDHKSYMLHTYWFCAIVAAAAVTL